MGPFSNIKGLTYYKDNEEDPYITLQDVCCMIYAHSTLSLTEFFKEDDDEREELEVLPTDNLIVFRFITGFCSSAFLSVAGGSVSDLFENRYVATCVAPQLAQDYVIKA